MTLPCLILAAGFGTRMGALTAERPKPLIPVAGRTLLDRALDVARGVGAGPIAVNAHYRADQIAAHLAGARDVTVLLETPEILDSGGAVKNFAEVLGLAEGAVLTLNADAVWTGPNPLEPLLALWDAGRMTAALSLVPRTEAVGRRGGGDFAMDSAGRLTLDKAAGPWVYTGAQILDLAPILAVPDRVFSLRRPWSKAQAQGRLFGALHGGLWGDVGHPEGLAEAEAMVARHG